MADPQLLKYFNWIDTKLSRMFHPGLNICLPFHIFIHHNFTRVIALWYFANFLVVKPWRMIFGLLLAYSSSLWSLLTGIRKLIKAHFYVPATMWGGHTVLLLSVHTSICSPINIHLSHFVVNVLFLSPQVLLQYLMQGSETCNTVQICIEHVHKGNRLLIQVIIAEVCPTE